jgi:hypothetical protein
MKSKLPFNPREILTRSSLLALVLCWAATSFMAWFQPWLPPAQSWLWFAVQVSTTILVMSLASGMLCQQYANHARFIRLKWLIAVVGTLALSALMVVLLEISLNASLQRAWWGSLLAYGIPILAIACGIGQLTVIPRDFSHLRQTRREFIDWRQSGAM